MIHTIITSSRAPSENDQYRIILIVESRQLSFVWGVPTAPGAARLVSVCRPECPREVVLVVNPTVELPLSCRNWTGDEFDCTD